MISHERYAELLSKHINRTITDSEQNDITNFEAALPKTCPKCHTAVWSAFLPPRVVHDVAKCDGRMEMRILESWERKGSPVIIG